MATCKWKDAALLSVTIAAFKIHRSGSMYMRDMRDPTNDDIRFVIAGVPTLSGRDIIMLTTSNFTHAHLWACGSDAWASTGIFHTTTNNEYGYEDAWLPRGDTLLPAVIKRGYERYGVDNPFWVTTSKSPRGETLILTEEALMAGKEAGNERPRIGL